MPRKEQQLKTVPTVVDLNDLDAIAVREVKAIGDAFDRALSLHPLKSKSKPPMKVASFDA